MQYEIPNVDIYFILAYIQAKRPENLIFVDWHQLSRQIIYFRSANNTEKVGLRVAQLLITLRNDVYIKTLEDVHIVGFSLGAHCSGIAAYFAREFIQQKVGRITGIFLLMLQCYMLNVYKIMLEF